MGCDGPDANGVGDACDAKIGDCNHNGAVTIDELMTGVNITLGITTMGQCLSFDPNDDQRVTIDELVAGVNEALAAP